MYLRFVLCLHAVEGRGFMLNLSLEKAVLPLLDSLYIILSLNTGVCIPKLIISMQLFKKCKDFIKPKQ